MRENALVFIFLSCFCCKSSTYPFNLTARDGNVTATDWVQPIQEASRHGVTYNIIVYKIVKRYSCYFKDADDSELLMYGSRAWEFPEQDVELKLNYPSEYMEEESEGLFSKHVVSGIEVLLYSSGTQSKAFISAGGLLQRNISLTFLCGDSTSVGYQFWVYGVPESRETRRSKHTETFMC